jgi:inorganic pyrophosphatase
LSLRGSSASSRLNKPKKEKPNATIDCSVAANSAAHRSIRQLSDLSQDLVVQIEHFFVSYNEMKGKRFEVKRRADSKRARALVMAAMKRRR